MVRFLQATASLTWRNKLRITSEIILKISTILSKTKKKQKSKKLHHLSDTKKIIIIMEEKNNKHRIQRFIKNYIGQRSMEHYILYEHNINT